ncbi:(2Fe-2S)-binding protein [Radiobacillus sp. PE A8.2]|uniref:(2Fe-2S)-binding protein n=1 Tax=Radiobacillus sp. PE A8.2 TaxID=3380349 RepID=UPI00388EB4C2
MEQSKPITLDEKSSKQIKVSMTINGEYVELTVAPTMRLVDLLRQELDLTGTKIACGIGRCGACSVHLNDQLVNACLVLAYQADGASITTIEGLTKQEQKLHIIQRAFLEEGGFQCGYCTPGMVMATKSLLDQNSSPSDSEIQDALSGNLCRCTGYGGIIRAVKRAAVELNT